MTAITIIRHKMCIRDRVETLDSGIVTVNTEIAEKVGIDYSIFKDMCSELIETVTAEEFN